ncbi:hypothetical protein AB0F88_17395 [Streptosporangium sp. NPDC023963]|uniref:hypothetical protein n=1 Tax=Streptosporangium sp. NPDC023963 TaxID=3155608 RepID=UPI00342F05BA
MHRTPEAAEIHGRRLAVSWLETLLALAAACVAATRFPYSQHPLHLAALSLLLLIGMGCAAVSALYACTHSTNPVALRLLRYLCAVGAFIAHIAL